MSRKVKCGTSHYLITGDYFTLAIAYTDLELDSCPGSYFWKREYMFRRNSEQLQDLDLLGTESFKNGSILIDLFVFAKKGDYAFVGSIK
jgi:hypothetical protein